MGEELGTLQADNNIATGDRRQETESENSNHTVLYLNIWFPNLPHTQSVLDKIFELKNIITQKITLFIDLEFF